VENVIRVLGAANVTVRRLNTDELVEVSVIRRSEKKVTVVSTGISLKSGACRAACVAMGANDDIVGEQQRW